MDLALVGLDRRAVLGGLAILPFLSRVAGAQSQTALQMVVFRNPTCGCCHKWVDHLAVNGFVVDVRDAANLAAIKANLGVPADLAACHTAEIGGYVIEGHVPAVAIKRLLAEKPAGRGLAVPGMPIGSPGMEVEGADPDVYEVVLFGAGAPQTFGRFRAADPL
jgi:hypothetical protein